MTALGTAACVDSSDEPVLTGVELLVSNDPALGLDSLALAGTVGDEAAFPATTLPDPPRPLAPTGENVVILLGDDLAGDKLELSIDGLAAGDIAASAHLEIELVAGRVLPLAIRLGPECVELECACEEEECACEEHGHDKCD